MDIIRLTYPFSALPESAPGQVMAIGYFDGVHAGHQELLRLAVSSARRSGKEQVAAVMTFDPHPREVLGGRGRHAYITPLHEKLRRFAELGLDRCYIVTFDKELSQLTPEQFVKNVLFSLRVDHAVVGFNFTFGHLGSGNAELLRSIGNADGRMRVSIVRPYMEEGMKVSSTRIRELLHAGDVLQVRRMLGRPYSLTGRVVHGAGRGRTIGVPTANIEPDEAFIVPDNGVYAVRLEVGGQRFGGVLNIGVKPTFEPEDADRTLEVHIFQFDRDIYGESVRLEFVDFIRRERKFAQAEQLVSQIRADMDTARKMLSAQA